MRVLLDTHVLLWLIEGDERLPQAIRQLLNDKTTQKCISTASFWELTIKVALNKLQVASPPAEMYAQIQNSDAILLGIQPRHLARLQILPHHHRDPFDRLLIATALAEELTIVSADSHFQDYDGLNLLWG